MKRHDVLERCRLAAEAITKLPYREWCGWVCWIVEALDEAAGDGNTGLRRADGADSAELINDIIVQLEARIEEGRW